MTITQIRGHGGRYPEWIALCRVTQTPAELRTVQFADFTIEDPGYWSSFAIVNVAGLGDVLLEWQSPYETDVEPQRDTLMVATYEPVPFSDEDRLALLSALGIPVDSVLHWNNSEAPQ